MGWKPSHPSPEEVQAFRSILIEHDITPVYVHAPYLVNLAAPNPDIWARSRESLAAALGLAETMGARYVVTHLGSHVGTGLEAGLDRVVEAVSALLEDPAGPMLLLENSPGSRNELGSYFEELGDLMKRLDAVGPRLGVCLDTAHLWGAGYDLSSQKGVKETLARFGHLVGLGRLNGIHANDSTVARGSRWDLHARPGEGQIGVEGFRALITDPLLEGMSYILELPRVHDEECVSAVAGFKALTGSGVQGLGSRV